MVGEYHDAVTHLENNRESGAIVPAAYSSGAMVAAYQLEDDEYREAYPTILFRDFLIDYHRARRHPDER